MVDLGARTLALGLLLALCLAAASPAGAAESASEREYTLVPVSIMLLPSVSLPPAARPKTLSVVALNCGVGYTDRLAGVGAGIITLVGEDAAGLMSGVGNYVGRDLEGAQAGVVNFAAGLRGAQFGVVNTAGRARGLQVGLVNVARELEGVPLGLISVVLRGGLTRGQVWVDELGGINAALLHGSRMVYNVYTLGIDQDREWWTGGFGLGVHLPAARGYVNLEAVTGGLLRAGGSEGSGQVLVHRARVYAGARIARGAALFAGASFNYAAAVDGGVPDLPPVLHGIEFPFSSERHRFWPGLFAGLEF